MIWTCSLFNCRSADDMDMLSMFNCRSLDDMDIALYSTVGWSLDDMDMLYIQL